LADSFHAIAARCGGAAADRRLLPLAPRLLPPPRWFGNGAALWFIRTPGLALLEVSVFDSRFG